MDTQLIPESEQIITTMNVNPGDIVVITVGTNDVSLNMVQHRVSVWESNETIAELRKTNTVLVVPDYVKVDTIPLMIQNYIRDPYDKEQNSI